MRHPDGSLTVSYKVEFTRGPRGRKHAAPVADPKPEPQPLKVAIDPSSIPKLTRLLVLGHRFERLIRDGVVKDLLEIAKLTGLSKSRVTQIANLTLLSAALQAEILEISNEDVQRHSLHERYLRHVAETADWERQRAAWTKPQDTP